MKSYIPKYTFKFPNNLPIGDNGYTLTYIKQMISEFVYDMGNLENNPLLSQKFRRCLMV